MLYESGEDHYSPSLIEEVPSDAKRILRLGLVCASAGLTLIVGIEGHQLYENNQRNILTAAYLMQQDGFQPTSAHYALGAVMSHDRYRANLNLGDCTTTVTADASIYPDTTPRDITEYTFETNSGRMVRVENYQQLIQPDNLGPKPCKDLA